MNAKYFIKKLSIQSEFGMDIQKTLILPIIIRYI